MAKIVKKIKINDFCSMLKAVDPHSCYCWGGQGEKLNSVSEKWIKNKETSTANANRVIKMWNKNKGYDKAQFFDCSGFGVDALLKLGAISSDTTAEGLRQMCVEITKAELQKGDCVFKMSNGKATHIIYVVDENLTRLSARGRDYNVPYVGETVSASKVWYGRPGWYEDEPVSKGYPVTRNLKKGMKGADVKAMQKALLKLGYNFGKYSADASYGSVTLKTVKQFQKDQHIAVDGIAGKNTIGKLEKLTKGILYWAGK